MPPSVVPGDSPRRPPSRAGLINHHNPAKSPGIVVGHRAVVSLRNRIDTKHCWYGVFKCLADKNVPRSEAAAVAAVVVVSEAVLGNEIHFTGKFRRKRVGQRNTCGMVLVPFQEQHHLPRQVLTWNAGKSVTVQIFREGGNTGR